MSVLIKGMKKPEKCEDCRCICSCGDGWRCGLVITNGRRHGYSLEELHNACPLTKVTELKLEKGAFVSIENGGVVYFRESEE